MLGAIKYNLGHLLDFDGRDARQTFWFYVLFLFLVYMALSMIFSFVWIGGLVGPLVETASSGASQAEIDAEVARHMGSAMNEMMGSMVRLSIAGNVVMVLLLAAAFVRRLHDSNLSGRWGLLVLAAEVAGIAAAFPAMAAMQNFMAEAMDPTNLADPARMAAMIDRQSWLAGYSLIGWIAPLAAIAFAVRRSTDGPNRYGEAPVRF